MTQLMWKVFSICALLYFGIALYGTHSTCRDAGGVLATGIGWFVCVEELKEAEATRGRS